MQTRTKVVAGLWALAAGIGFTAVAIAAPKVIYSPRVDSGVAFCKAAAEDKKDDPFGNGENDGKLTEQEYKDARKVFEKSRDEEIRRHGTALMDAAWSISQVDENSDDAIGVAFAQVGPMMASINGLTGACAKRGYAIKLNTDNEK